MPVIIQSQVVEILDELLNQKARLRKGGLQAVYFCPECKHYKRKLEFNLETGQWHCWTCNIKGTFFGSFLSKVKAPKSFRDRMFKLTGDLRLARRDRVQAVLEEVALPNEFHPLSQPRRFCPEYRNALVYLKHRGVLREDILRYNIGYCDNGSYGQHVIIPSYDAAGKLNFFIARRYYENDPGIPHKKPLGDMNIVGFESFVNYNEPLVLVESAFNAITIRNNAIPLFGKYPSKKLYETMIRNRVEKVYVCLDSDADEDAVNVCERLMKWGITPYFVETRGGKDANEVGFEKMHQFIRDAKEVDFEFLMKKRLGM